LLTYRRAAKQAAERRAALSINFKFRASDMRKMDLIFGWCDSYLQISRYKDDGRRRTMEARPPHAFEMFVCSPFVLLVFRSLS
jgi:hypothetical protein